MLRFKKITNHFLSKNIWSVEKLIVRNISARQIELVKATAPVLANRGVEITTHFYKNMLGDNPELKNLFNLTHQATGAQAAALAHAVWLYADNIDNLDALKSAISRIGNKHASLGVKPDDYSIVGKYLLFSIKSVLGDSIDDETLESWEEAYKQLAGVFIKTEGDLYKSAKNTPGGWSDWRKFAVSKKIQESNEIISFYLTPEDGKLLPNFKPGQFVTVRCFIPELSVFQLRQYSLSDTFDDKYFRISVKREYAIQDKPEGYISNILHNSVKEGSVIEVSMPYGDFFLNVDSQDPVVLISGGVGLTPMMSMLKSLIKQGSGRKITFIHAARSGEVHAMKEDLDFIVKENPQVSKVVFYESVTEKDMKNKTYDHIGRINLDFIKNELLPTNADYYVCGPVQFMTIQKDKLRNLGIQEDRIHSEIFSTS
jgi:ferredoxin-NADP reductase/hemoglobin-like flavoprotein